jgi:preprotein translocase subunit SecE
VVIPETPERDLPTDPAGAGRGRGRSNRADRRDRGPGRIARLMIFLREVVAEMRKVIWPTRKELVTYTTVVLVFVSVMVAIVAALDFVFTEGVLAVFG